MCSSDIFLGFLAILFPPLPVWVKCGICSADSIINILLCVLGFLPGLLHAWYIIAKFPDDHDYQRVPQDAEGGRVTYVIVQEDGRRERRQQQGPRGQKQPKPQGGMNYGTAQNNGNAPSSSSSTAAQAGSSNGERHEPAPPTYAEAVKGDNKVQTSD
ncbi:hypothetical protein JX265_000170 [Neoarthrinium moseri]|uniref:Stress response RCI peptide n=2 Tax=Neoarthrinium moseri TaxID=1658444 RepID=A0A9P9WY10_9PEZI|nr:hypothetical protein JX266_002037 [Neoarthrinium moseri]KAI1881344.1 hypothetical protein JX265_000170 [Neoarthrinium moseri]